MIKARNIAYIGLGGVVAFLLYRHLVVGSSRKVVATEKPEDKVYQIDWQKTYDMAMVKCLDGDVSQCARAERAKMQGKNIQTVDMPQPASVDPARDNAIRACNDGDNKACCWLKTIRKQTPPKPCVPESGQAGLGGYYYG